MDRDAARELLKDIEVFLRFINLHLDPADQGRTGGWLFIADSEGEMILHEQIGTIAEPAKNGRYLALSVEQAVRLFEHPDHRTSWQSRDPDRDRWGGAFRTDDGWVISFCGLPELWNEALVLGVARICTNIHDWTAIASPGVAEKVEIIMQIEDRVDD